MLLAAVPCQARKLALVAAVGLVSLDRARGFQARLVPCSFKRLPLGRRRPLILLERGVGLGQNPGPRGRPVRRPPRSRRALLVSWRRSRRFGHPNRRARPRPADRSSQPRSGTTPCRTRRRRFQIARRTARRRCRRCRSRRSRGGTSETSTQALRFGPDTA